MNKLFPDMTDRPDGRKVFGALAYCLWPYMVLPFFFMLFLGVMVDQNSVFWVEGAYYVINFFAALIILREYLMDSLMLGRFYIKKILSTAAICIVLMLSIGVIHLQVEQMFYTSLPVADTGLFMSSLQFLLNKPLLGSICAVLLSPLVVTGLFYVVAFCPACYERRWLGYLTVAIWLLVPHLLSAFTFYSDFQYELPIYLIRLPVHLIACWGYQKSDSVLTPILSLTVVNLVGCLYLLTITGLL